MNKYSVSYDYLTDKDDWQEAWYRSDLTFDEVVEALNDKPEDIPIDNFIVKEWGAEELISEEYAIDWIEDNVK